MRIGIVGSRKIIDAQIVEDIVNNLSPMDVVVSGGCKGPDTYAEDRAIAIGLKTTIHKPDLDGITDRGDMINRYYERNRRVVQDCDLLIAFVNKDRKGGTENTIMWAKKLGVRHIIIEEK